MRTRLSAMMFGQYFIWGAWWVTLGTYMNAIGFDAFIGQTYSVQGWAAIFAPLVFGVIADKYVSAQKIFALLHLAAGGMLLWLSQVTGNPSTFFLVALGVMILYMPTIALSNTIAFSVLSDVQRQFPAIRVFGTIGWIVAGLAVGYYALEQTRVPIQIAATASIVLGIYGFTLPAVPPRPSDDHSGSLLTRVGLDMFRYMRGRSFWVFIVASLLICIPLSFYYSYTNTFLVEKGVKAAAAVQSLGQMSEIFFLLLLPFFLQRFGIKKVIIIGMLAWSVRYVAFAYGFEGASAIMPLLVLGIILHGICYDFFFVAGQIYVDQHVGVELRARAQAFLSLVTLGIGTILGTNLAGVIYNANTITESVHEWRTIWMIPAVLALVVAIGFALTFDGKSDAERAAQKGRELV